MIMPFGKYKDSDLTDVPIDYLRWLEQQNIDDVLRDAIVFEMKRRSSDETSRGRDVKLMTRKQLATLYAYKDHLAKKMIKFNFIGKTNPEMIAQLQIWTDEFRKQHEIVDD